MLNPLKNVVVIGDRILLKPLEASNKTGSGLYLPPSVKERDAWWCAWGRAIRFP